MMLAAMQSFVSELYGLELEYDVYDFLITDRLLAHALGGGERTADEELLIVEGDGEAQVSLFLAQELMARLERDDPTSTLTNANIADFWVALEGVSHFTYFVYKASRDHCVTRLEMELQAEVDKFVATALMLRAQGEQPPAGLHHLLFDACRLHSDLSRSEHERYDQANRYAARYCRCLWPEVRGGVARDELKRELRRFYRMPSEAKIGHIESR